MRGLGFEAAKVKKAPKIPSLPGAALWYKSRSAFKATQTSKRAQFEWFPIPFG